MNLAFLRLGLCRTGGGITYVSHTKYSNLGADRKTKQQKTSKKPQISYSGICIYSSAIKKDLDDILEGLWNNEHRYGYPSCPCRMAGGVVADDMDIICPCTTGTLTVWNMDAARARCMLMMTG
ncbi:MAG: ferredoxin-thioredoxin reductase catalytic domain-containing protein [Nitrospirota bacterium]|nr:ferredoxin-thioredoxin reductase catalytic domain-containing protein [Nitrospirota bacterium]